MRAKFVRELRIPSPLAINERYAVSGRFKVESLAQIVLIDRKGKVRAIRVGNHPDEMRELRSTVRRLLSE